MTAPAWFAVLVALSALVVLVAEVVTARRRERPVQVTRVAVCATVVVFALACAWLLGFSVYGALGMPRRYATYQPEPPVAVRPEVFLILAGVVVVVIGLIRTSRAARSAGQLRSEAAVADSTSNLVIVLSGIGIVLLGVLALLG